MAFRVEGSVAKRKPCITPTKEDDAYISGAHWTLGLSFSVKGMLEKRKTASTAASSNRVSELLDSVSASRRRTFVSRASWEQFSRLGTSVGTTEVGWRACQIVKQSLM